jgi:type II secretory pathway pseudopilin PulG
VVKRERNNKGITLLELIVSMAISIIVVLMIVSFINSSFRVFRGTNDLVQLQMEAQTSINQLVNLAMEAKAISNETVILADKDIRYQIDRIDLTGYHDYAVIWRKDYRKLYLVELIPPFNSIVDVSFDNEEHFDQEYLLAEYVDDFGITSVAGKASLKNIKVRMVFGDEEYEISKEIILRNAN